MAFIEVENLKYRYPHTEELALKGLNFQVEKGQFIGIAGKNKSGKSTLCQAMAGLVPNMFKGAYGGRVLIGGREAARTPVAELCGQVGLVFQNPFNQLSGARDTVFEEVAFGLQNLGVPRQEIFDRVEEALALLDMADLKDRNPFDLSGGQTQRVAIASILAMKPEVLVLDEPTSQLDPRGSEEVFRVVERLAGTGITILMAEHKMEKLAAYCDRILLLCEGEQAAYDEPGRVFSRGDLRELGMKPPVYTGVCRALNIFKEEGVYPATLEETAALREKFPRDLTGRGRDSFRPGGEAVFEIRDLSFRYGNGAWVLQGLNLKLDSRPTAFIGQNGAGKTTLAKLLKGLLKPKSGDILLRGESLTGRTAANLAAAVGYVFQNPDDQIFKNRVLDEVMVGPLNIGMDRETAREKSLAALELVGLKGLEEKNPYDLELSDRKLTAAASVLAMDTEILILDEPTIAQDARGQEIIGRIVQEISGRGKLVLSILHDMDFVARYFERVVVMAHGRVEADGTAGDVFYRPEALSGACLEPPHITGLCSRLGYDGIFLTERDIFWPEGGGGV